MGQSGGGGDANDNGGDDQPDSLDWTLADFDQGVVQALRDQSMVDFITRNALPQFDRPARPSSQYVEGYTLATRAVAAAQIGAGLITVAGGTTLAILSPASGPGAGVVIVVSAEAVVFGGALATVGVGNLLNPTALMEKGGGGGGTKDSPTATATGKAKVKAKDRRNAERREVKKDGTPGNNQAQNKQFRDATRGLSKAQKRQIHDEVTGRNMSYQEIKALADALRK